MWRSPVRWEEGACFRCTFRVEKEEVGAVLSHGAGRFELVSLRQMMGERRSAGYSTDGRVTFWVFGGMMKGSKTEEAAVWSMI